MSPPTARSAAARAWAWSSSARQRSAAARAGQRWYVRRLKATDGLLAMTYANGRTICDADSHLMELPDFLTRHADPADRALMPTLGALATGQFNPGDHVGKAGHAPERVAELIALGDGLTRGPKWHDALGSFSGPERKQALDLLGFE